MRKFGLFLSVLILVGVAVALFINRPQARPKEYGFLKGATLVESVKKDPRYGGGQRDVYEVRGELNEVLERVRREVAPASKTKNVSPSSVSYYPDGDNTIIVGAGKAVPWSDFAKTLAVTKEQETREIMQKGAVFRPAPGLVTIIIDRPYAELAAKALTGLSRKLSPPKPKPLTVLSVRLVRVGTEIEAEFTITNKGTDTQDEYSINNLKIGGVAPSGMPITVTNLKPGASHVETFKLPNIKIKDTKVPYRVDIKATYKGASSSTTFGSTAPAP